jgi:hypothetical protein
MDRVAETRPFCFGREVVAEGKKNLRVLGERWVWVGSEIFLKKGRGCQEGMSCDRRGVVTSDEWSGR